MPPKWFEQSSVSRTESQLRRDIMDFVDDNYIPIFGGYIHKEDDPLIPCLAGVAIYAADHEYSFRGTIFLSSYTQLCLCFAPIVFSPKFDRPSFLILLRQYVLPGVRLTSGNAEGSKWDRLIGLILLEEMVHTFWVASRKFLLNPASLHLRWRKSFDEHHVIPTVTCHCNRCCPYICERNFILNLVERDVEPFPVAKCLENMDAVEGELKENIPYLAIGSSLGGCL